MSQHLEETLINSITSKSLRPLKVVVFVFMEVFKDVKGYEGLYQVSDLGRVKSLERTVRCNGGVKTVKERILKAVDNSYGYLHVNLHKILRQKCFKVHRLVAIAFHDHIPNGLTIVIDHINNIQHDNRAVNLQIITTRENSSKDRKGGHSRYTGVTWDKCFGKWVARIQIKGKSKYLGRFNSETDAHKAYQHELSSNSFIM